MTTESIIPAALQAAYRATDYVVSLAAAPLVLRVGVESQPLRELHALWRVEGSAFLTAWNPYSRAASPDFNDAANERLRARCRQGGWSVLEGHGVYPEGGWPAESSLLVLGMDRDSAIAVGREFEQNAIVWSGAAAVPELVLLR